MNEQAQLEKRKELQERYDELLHACEKLSLRIGGLQEKKRDLQAQINTTRRELYETNRLLEEADYARQEELWDAVVAEQVGRWSPRWWSSHGWVALAKDIEWNDNLSFLIATVAELQPRDRFVLECWHGIGIERVGTFRKLSAVLPNTRTWEIGLSNPAAAREVLWGASERLRHRLTLYQQKPWNRLWGVES